MAKKYSTSTIKSDGTIVPWLAAEGPLAYTPENPPESNYLFQYSWLMPSVYKDKTHYYFVNPSLFFSNGPPGSSAPGMCDAQLP